MVQFAVEQVKTDFIHFDNFDLNAGARILSLPMVRDRIPRSS